MQTKITKERLIELLTARHSCNSYKRLADLPSPSSFKDIKKAAIRIKEAILNKENITVVGDYDVDGVVSTTIMIDFFEKIGYPIKHIIPNRFKHGYGLSPKIVDKLPQNGVVITVDNGISAIETAKILKEKGIDLIITDHHTVGEKVPDALAIINPKQSDCEFPYKEICGAQVAWYFCAQVKQELNININMSQFLDVLAIAIIADIMPMTSLNFTMVKQGLKKIKTSQRASMLELNSMMRKESFISDDIGFFIAPKLNSAGRMEDASTALNFLLAKNQFIARDYLYDLNDLNELRKKLQNEISKKAIDEVREDDKVIVVWGDDWHEGVIGIVASKTSNHFKKPSFIFSINEEGIAKGSARSNGDVHLYDLISKASHLLLGFGGHKNAAGLSLKAENLEAFREEVNNILKNEEINLHYDFDTLGELDVSCVDLEFLEIIESFEPYGLENEKPLFSISNSKIVKHDFIGKDKNHIKFTLSSNGYIFEALQFNCDSFDQRESLDLVVSVNKNEFRGNVTPQFLIQEILN